MNSLNSRHIANSHPLNLVPTEIFYARKKFFTCQALLGILLEDATHFKREFKIILKISDTIPVL